MLSFLWYILFSTLETISYFVMMKTMFRYNPLNYIKEIVVVSIVIALLSFLVRLELNIKDLFPLVVLLIFFAYTKIVIRSPFIWSIIISGGAYFIFLLLQTGILIGMTSAGMIDLSSAQNGGVDQYIGQTITAAVIIGIFSLLYKAGIGFSHSFDKFRFYGENLIASIIIVAALATVIYLFIRNSLYIAVAPLLVLSLISLYYNYRKEKEHDFKIGQ